MAAATTRVVISSKAATHSKEATDRMNTTAAADTSNLTINNLPTRARLANTTADKEVIRAILSKVAMTQHLLNTNNTHLRHLILPTRAVTHTTKVTKTNMPVKATPKASVASWAVSPEQLLVDTAVTLWVVKPAMAQLVPSSAL